MASIPKFRKEWISIRKTSAKKKPSQRFAMGMRGGNTMTMITSLGCWRHFLSFVFFVLIVSVFLSIFQYWVSGYYADNFMLSRVMAFTHTGYHTSAKWDQIKAYHIYAEAHVDFHPSWEQNNPARRPLFKMPGTFEDINPSHKSKQGFQHILAFVIIECREQLGVWE